MAITADDIAVQYPIPAYRFIVTLGDEQVPLTSTSGLDINLTLLNTMTGLVTGKKCPTSDRCLISS